MATIIQKNSRRHRIQLSMSSQLYNNYEANLQRAKKLQVSLDFTKDFERWFASQMEQVNKELQMLEAQGGSDAVVKQVSRELQQHEIQCSYETYAKQDTLEGSSNGDD